MEPLSTNRIVNNYLLLFVADIQQDWDKSVPLFLLSYKSSSNKASWYSPAMLLTIWSLLGLMFVKPPAEEESYSILLNYVRDLEELTREGYWVRPKGYLREPTTLFTEVSSQPKVKQKWLVHVERLSPYNGW